MINEKQQLELAKAQFLGYRHAQQGYSVKHLVNSMGLTSQEWSRIKDNVDLSESDFEDVENYFKSNRL